MSTYDNDNDNDGNYTPDTRDVEDEYTFGKGEWTTLPSGEIRAEFERWLEQHDSEVRAATYDDLAADPYHGWAIATSLIDMAKVERGQMTQAEMDKNWGVNR